MPIPLAPAPDLKLAEYQWVDAGRRWFASTTANHLKELRFPTCRRTCGDRHDRKMWHAKREKWLSAAA